MAAPSFISATLTSFSTTTSPKTTASIAVQNGDVLVAHGMDPGSGTGTDAVAIATATGSTSAWTLQRDVVFNDSSHPYRRSWTATATATGNITVSFTKTGTSTVFGGVVKVWRGSGGIGNTNSAGNGTGSGAPSVGVTTTGANSGLDFADADWNGVTGTVTFTASNGSLVTDVSDQTSSANYCVYSSHVVDAGAAGAKTMGMSAPSTQRYDCAVVEVLGQASAVKQINNSILQAVKRASYW